MTRMTREEIRAAALRLVERTTAASGVPRYIEDPVVLRKIARILEENERQIERERQRGAGPGERKPGPGTPST